MKLTGKCKEDFLEWFKKSEKIKLHKYEKVEIVFKIQNESYKNALIIEFFDSVGIKVLIDTLHFQNWFFYKIKNNINIIEDVIMYNSRIKATNEAIIKANEIYNSK